MSTNSENLMKIGPVYSEIYGPMIILLYAGTQQVYTYEQSNLQGY